jgi:hypothetical protein
MKPSAMVQWTYTHSQGLDEAFFCYGAVNLYPHDSFTKHNSYKNVLNVAVLFLFSANSGFKLQTGYLKVILSP